MHVGVVAKRIDEAVKDIRPFLDSTEECRRYAEEKEECEYRYQTHLARDMTFADGSLIAMDVVYLKLSVIEKGATLSDWHFTGRLREDGRIDGISLYSARTFAFRALIRDCWLDCAVLNR